jgi:hypothetical protein
MSEQVAASAPEPQAAAPVPPAAPESAETPKKSGGAVKKIVGVLVVAAIVIGVKFAVGSGLGELWSQITGDVTTASVGDCVNEWTDPDDAKVVDCNDASAKNKVVGIVEDKYTQAAFSAQLATGNPCEAYPTAESAIWVGGSGTGDVWCMAAK